MEERSKRTLNIDKNLLDCFYRLTNKNTNLRIIACADILNTLTNKQHEIDDENGISKDLQYCIERLVKGLASSRDAARMGFCLLLTEVLKKHPIVKLEEVLELVKTHLALTGKQDKKDLVFGHFFAYTAIIRSGRLPNHHCLSNVVLSLYDLSHAKEYILNACYKVMLDLFSQISSENFKESVWSGLKKKLPNDWETCTADTLWFLLLCLRLFPTCINEKYMRNHWGSTDMFSPENLNHLKRIIKQTSSSLPMLHPLCVEILMNAKQRKDFNEIWNAVVDDNLFDVEQKEKAFIGFEMIKLALSSEPTKKIVKTVLSLKFRTAFSYVFYKSKHNLNPAANHLAEFLCTFVKNNAVPEFHILILKAVLQPPGTLLLEQALKKKEVKSIIQNLLPDAVKAYSEILKSVILKKKCTYVDGSDANIKIRSSAVQQLGNLVACPAMLSDLDWRMSVIQFLFLHSFFTVKEATSEISHCEKQYDPLPDQLHDACKNALFQAVRSLHIRTENQHFSHDVFLERLMSLTDYADLILNATENVEALFPKEKIQVSWYHLKTIINKLNKQSKKDGQVNESNAFKALFLQLSFQLFQDPDHIPEILEELYICCKKALRLRKKDSNISEECDSEPPWIGVLIDILLSLLSKSSKHLRSLVSHVFPLFCPFIDQNALQQILDVINPQKDDDMLVDDDDEENEDEKSDNVDFSSGSSSDEFENEQDNQPVDVEFRKKIQQALGPAADNSDAESVVLSDAEMFKLDDALSQAFKMRKKTGHSQFAPEDKTMLDFRTRVCDLVLAFLRSEPPMNLALMCVEPILAAFELGHRSKHQIPLLNRSIQLLQAITKLRKFRTYQDVSKSELKRLLDMLIPKCHREINLPNAQKLYSLCVFIVLCYRKLEISDTANKKIKSKLPTYIKTYLTCLETFVSSGSSNLFPPFFTQLMETCPDLSWHFIEPCKNYAFNTSNVRLFKRTQCLKLLSEILKYSKGQKHISSEQWLEYGNDVFPIAIEALKSALDNTEIKLVYFTNLLNVIYNTHSIVQEKTGKSLLEDHVDILTLLSNNTKAKLKNLNSEGKCFKNKIITCLGGNVNKSEKSEKKRKRKLVTEDNSEIPETESQNLVHRHLSKKSKRKKSKKKKSSEVSSISGKDAAVDTSKNVSDDSD